MDDGAEMPADADKVRQHLSALAMSIADVGGLVVRVSTRHPHARSRHPSDARRDPNVYPRDAASISVQAGGIDGFFGSELDSILRRAGREQLLVTGHFLEISVHSTLRSANDRGYECLTIADACVAADAQTVSGAISSIEMSGGIFGAVGSTAHVITAVGAFAATGPTEELA
jgi:nicotinamidase-related amidase